MPYMGYYGIDMYYIVLVLPCVLFAFWAQSQGQRHVQPATRAS